MRSGRGYHSTGTDLAFVARRPAKTPGLAARDEDALTNGLTTAGSAAGLGV